MTSLLLNGNGADSEVQLQKPMIRTASAVAICGRRGPPESASTSDANGSLTTATLKLTDNNAVDQQDLSAENGTTTSLLLNGNGADSAVHLQKPMIGPAYAGAICGRRGPSESASTSDANGSLFTPALKDADNNAVDQQNLFTESGTSDAENELNNDLTPMPQHPFPDTDDATKPKTKYFVPDFNSKLYQEWLSVIGEESASSDRKAWNNRAFQGAYEHNLKEAKPLDAGTCLFRYKGNV